MFWIFRVLGSLGYQHFGLRLSQLLTFWARAGTDPLQIGSYLSFLCIDFPIDGFVFRHFNSACSSLDLKCLKTMPSIGKPTHKKDK